MMEYFCSLVPGFTMGLLFGISVFYLFLRRSEKIGEMMCVNKVQTTLDVIKSRRTITPKNFNGKRLTENEIGLLLEAANWAPTHKKTEPW